MVGQERNSPSTKPFTPRVLQNSYTQCCRNWCHAGVLNTPTVYSNERTQICEQDRELHSSLTYRRC